MNLNRGLLLFVLVACVTAGALVSCIVDGAPVIPDYVKEACEPEAQRLCPDEYAEGKVPKLTMCMFKHQKEYNDACKAAVKKWSEPHAVDRKDVPKAQ